ncbi:MAG: hypothetical protein F6K04_05150 [Leptolyngbya sp. SIO4C5]|nr:hypothetical protein [Leptolyngbya sp. SIO4C5]
MATDFDQQNNEPVYLFEQEETFLGVIAVNLFRKSEQKKSDSPQLDSDIALHLGQAFEQVKLICVIMEFNIC